MPTPLQMVLECMYGVFSYLLSNTIVMTVQAVLQSHSIFPQARIDQFACNLLNHNHVNQRQIERLPLVT